jgi:hypothetical protein
MTVTELLAELRFTPDEFVSVNHKIGQTGTFHSAVMPPGQAPGYVEELPLTEADVWFGVNPVRGPERRGRGRGTERDVTRWAGCPLDVDVKEKAFAALEQAQEFIGLLSGMIGTRPTVVIYSGHGLQPIWTLEDAVLGDEATWGRAYRLSRRFGRLATHVAWTRFKANLDTVADLSRVLRVPGTFNHKDRLT